MPASTAIAELLTRAEADVLADARRLLDELDSRARTAGYRSEDSGAAMYLGRIAEAADVAGDVLVSLLISMNVYGESVEARYALDRDRPEARDAD